MASAAVASLLPLGVAAGCTAVLYLFLVVAMRLFSRRQLGQLTVIDLAVVLLLGSAVETAMIHGNTSLAVGLTSAATLLLLNKLMTMVFLRWQRLRQLVNGGPMLLAKDGALIDEQLHQIGMTAADVSEGIRSQGYETLERTKFVILETDGTFSVIPVPEESA